MPERRQPHVEVRRQTPYLFTRLPVPLSLIVLHDTESHNRPGVSDLESLGAWFASNPGKVAAHVATDGEGHSARFAPDSAKVYHCGAFNSASLGIEQIGEATQTAWPEAQLKETARWIALWSIEHHIPIQHGAVSGSSVVRPGVVRHMDLGEVGGGHHDPGPGYPVDHVLMLAQGFARRPTKPPDPPFGGVNLHEGMRSQAVAAWQRRLRRLGYDVHDDGVFGPQTKAQTIAFQRQHKLTPDGVVGPKTWAAAR